MPSDRLKSAVSQEIAKKLDQYQLTL